MARPRWRRMTILAVKSAVTVVVLWAVWRHVLRTWNDLRNQSQPIHLEVDWLIAAGLLYMVGLLACGRFFEQVLRSSPTPVRLFPALRAYVVSHLGKYVPGKAMVVVIRTGMVVPSGARPATAAIATFYETLVMMAAGGLIAAPGFACARGSSSVAFRVPLWGPVALPLYQLAAWGGLFLGLAFLVVALPAAFRRLAGLISLPIPGVGSDAMPFFTPGLLVRGLLWSSCGWCFLGASQLALVRAFGFAEMSDGRLVAMAPVVIGGVALATVAGFVVAVLPGGLGVREGVLMTLLAPAIGADQAVVASLSLRLVWVATELAAAAFLFPWFRRSSPDAAAHALSATTTTSCDQP